MKENSPKETAIKQERTRENTDKQFLEDFLDALYGNPNFQESYRDSYRKSEKNRLAICFFQDRNFFSFICYSYAGYAMESLQIAAINKKGGIVPQESLVVGHSDGSRINIAWFAMHNPHKNLDSPEKRIELLAKLRGDYSPAA